MQLQLQHCLHEENKASTSHPFVFYFLLSHTEDESEHYLPVLWILDEYSCVSCIKDNSSYEVFSFFMNFFKGGMCQTWLPGHWPKEYILVHDISVAHTTWKSSEDQTEPGKQLPKMSHRIFKMQDKQALDFLLEGLANWREPSSSMACLKPFSTSEDKPCSSDSQNYWVTFGLHNPSVLSASTAIYRAPGLWRH